MPFILHLDLATDLEAPLRARRFLRGCLSELADRSLEDVVLATSEVVGNRVRQIGGSHEPISLTVEVTDAVVRVDVSDERLGRDREIEPERDRLGAMLVSNLTSAWGSYTDERHHVWFEIETTQAGGNPTS